MSIALETGVKKAIQWIGQQRHDDPKASVATLIEEACRKFDLSPLQADFLYRHFAE